MPDDDRFPAGLPRHWHRIARTLSRCAAEPALPGRANGERLGAEVAKALAATLRETGGVPHLPQLAAELNEGGHRASAQLELAVRAMELAPPPDDHPHTVLAWELARGLLAQRGRVAGPPEHEVSDQELAHRTLERIADRYCFDRLLPQMVADGMLSASAAHHLVRIAFRHPSVALLARNLLRRPEAQGLRAMGTGGRRHATADLLNVPLGEL